MTTVAATGAPATDAEPRNDASEWLSQHRPHRRGGSGRTGSVQGTGEPVLRGSSGLRPWRQPAPVAAPVAAPAPCLPAPAAAAPPPVQVVTLPPVTTTKVSKKK